MLRPVHDGHVSTGEPGGRIVVSSRSGRVLISGEDRTDIEVDGASARHDDAGVLTVKGGSRSIEVRCPVGSDLVVGTSSATVKLRGLLGDVRVTTRSGSIDADEAATIEARSVSGRISIAATRQALVRVTSGRVDLRLGRSGSADVSAVSGSVSIKVPRGARPATALRSLTGAVDALPPGTDGSITVRTVSGSITVAEL